VISTSDLYCFLWDLSEFQEEVGMEQVYKEENKILFQVIKIMEKKLAESQAAGGGSTSH
jgi:hypothetical protein